MRPRTTRKTGRKACKRSTNSLIDSCSTASGIGTHASTRKCQACTMPCNESAPTPRQTAAPNEAQQRP
eukprot:5420578-Alexandrium_andersonii.AAC.1